MKYEKPNLALVASAVEAIKGGPPKDSDQIDTNQSTVNAYEADE